jgi:glycosyltransferase involved in cell wall biosynthesis
VPHEFYLVVDDQRSQHRSGRSGTLPWGLNVHEVHVDRVRDVAFDVVLFQSRHEWETRREVLSAEQLRLPCIYLEHDPPQEHPTDTLHWAAAEPGVLLVHVTAFNALMWNNGRAQTRVIDHGVLPLAQARYNGRRGCGIVVVNNLDLRGRRLGHDIYQSVSLQVPLVLVGMGSERIGGEGEVANDALPEFMADYRFFFNPIRYTSLGLAVIEAMMVGLPIIGLATTELVTVIRNGENGWLDTRPERLVEIMNRLIADPAEARRWGKAARQTALERFGIERFVADWLAALALVAGRG